MKRLIALIIGFCLIFEQAGFAQVAPQFVLPAYLQNHAPVSDAFRPIHLRSIAADPVTDEYHLVLDKGDSPVMQPQDVQAAAQTLIEYFEIGLRLPDNMFWVNLRPDAPQNIIDPHLAGTDMGRILLEADLQMKRDLSMFTCPDTKEGRKYWDALYAKAETLYGNSDVEIPTMTRPWIVPGEIIIGQDGGRVYIYKATLKVMLEQDYIKDAPFYDFKDKRLQEINAYSSQLIRKLILPRLTAEINASKRYAGLRQIYYSLIAAQWYKRQAGDIPEDLAAVVDSRDLDGLTSSHAWSPERYFAAYRRSFSEGEYDRTETSPAGNGVTIRRYFSGGAALQTSSFIALAMPARLDGGHIIEVVQPTKPTYSNNVGLIRKIISRVAYIERNSAIKQHIAPVTFDPQHNTEHLLLLRDYIRKQFCVDPQSDEAIEKQIERTDRNIMELVGTKRTAVNEKAFLKLLGGEISEYAVDGPLLRAIFTHKQPLRWPLTADRLEKMYKVNSNRRNFFRICDALEYLNIVKLDTRTKGKEKAIIKIDRERMELWYPEIRTYKAAATPKPPTDKSIFEDRFLQRMAEQQVNPLNQNAVMELLANMRVQRPDGTNIRSRTLSQLKRPFRNALEDERGENKLVDYMREIYKDKYGDTFDKRNGDLFDKRNGLVRPSFAGTRTQPARLDPLRSSKADALFDALWTSYRDSLEPAAQAAISGGYSPDHPEPFKEYIYNRFVIKTENPDGSTTEQYNWRAGKDMSQGQPYDNNFIRQIKRMLFPSAQEPWEKKTLVIIHAFGNKDGESLTIAQIEEQFRQAGQTIHIKQNINLDFLARLGLIDITRVGRNKVATIVHVYTDRFKLFYPDIKRYSLTDGNESDAAPEEEINITRTILQMVHEKMSGDDLEPPEATLDGILSAIDADTVSERLGRRPVHAPTVDTIKRRILSLRVNDIDALKKAGPAAVKLYRDGGTRQKAGGIDLRSLTAPVPAAAGTRAAVERRMVPVAVLRQQWQGILQAARRGPMPHDRIIEYVEQCNSQGETNLTAPVTDYIVTLMRAEEAYGVSSAPQIIQALVLALS